MVVSSSAEARWAMAGRLGLPPEAALAMDVAASRLAHPAVEPPDVVVLVVAGDDVGWLRAHTGRARGGRVPVLVVGAAVDRDRALRRAGAAATLPDGTDVGALREVLADLTQPAEVRRLPGSRSA